MQHCGQAATNASTEQRHLIPQQHRHVCTAAHTLATHACRHIAIFPMTRQATQLQQAPCRPCWGRVSKQGGLCAAVHAPQLVLAAVSAQTGLSLRLRRADALGARLRQLVGRGRRGRQHRLNLVQARPVLAGHEDALGRRVVRDACRAPRASCIQTETQYLPVTKLRLVAGCLPRTEGLMHPDRMGRQRAWRPIYCRPFDQQVLRTALSLAQALHA